MTEETKRKYVVVGCKLPQGCIMEVGYKMVPGGMQKQDNYQAIKLNGAEQHSLILAPGVRSASPVNLRPGITENVPAEVYAEWSKKGGKNLVRNGIVFSADTKADCQAIANEMTNEKIGMEAVDPSKHPGITKRTEGESDAKVA
jgi:hypothetical protein